MSKSDEDGSPGVTGRKKRAGARKAGADARKRQGLALLATGATPGQVCQELGVSRQTVQRWVQESGLDEEQAAAVAADEAARSDAAEEARRLLREAAPRAARDLIYVATAIERIRAGENDVVAAMDSKTLAAITRAADSVLSRGGAPILTEKHIAGMLKLDPDAVMEKLAPYLKAPPDDGET